MLSLLSAYDASFGPLRILHYITFRTLLATGTAALIGFIIGPWLIAHLRRLKFGQHYDDDRTGTWPVASTRRTRRPWEGS